MKVWVRLSPLEPVKTPVIVTRNPPVALDKHERVDEPLRVTLVGTKMQASPVRLTLLDNPTEPVRPLTAVTVMVEFPLPPTLVMVTGLGLAAIVKSPVTVTVMVAVELVTPLLVPPTPVITPVYVPGVEETRLHVEVAVPPAARVALGQVTTRPVAGEKTPLRVTVPVRPFVAPPRLPRLITSVVEPPVVTLRLVDVAETDKPPTFIAKVPLLWTVLPDVETTVAFSCHNVDVPN